HLDRAGLTQQRDDLAGRGTAHDRILDNDELLTPDVVAQRVELEADTVAPLLLVRLDERPPDVTILHEAVAVGDTRRTRVALRGGDSGFRNGHHHVGRIARCLVRELLAHALAGAVHALAVELRIRARDVHELEQAQLRVRLREPDRTNARGVDRDQLPGLDVTHEVRADDV